MYHVNAQGVDERMINVHYFLLLKQHFNDYRCIVRIGYRKQGCHIRYVTSIQVTGNRCSHQRCYMCTQATGNMDVTLGIHTQATGNMDVTLEIHTQATGNMDVTLEIHTQAEGNMDVTLEMSHPHRLQETRMSHQRCHIHIGYRKHGCHTRDVTSTQATGNRGLTLHTSRPTKNVLLIQSLQLRFLVHIWTQNKTQNKIK